MFQVWLHSLRLQNLVMPQHLQVSGIVLKMALQGKGRQEEKGERERKGRQEERGERERRGREEGERGGEDRKREGREGGGGDRNRKRGERGGERERLGF